MNSDEFKPVELLDIQLMGSTEASTIRLTSAGQTLTWRGNTYTPFHISRGQLDERLIAASGEAPAISCMVTNVDQQMAKLLANHPFDGSIATLYLTDRRLLGSMRPLDALISAHGWVANSALSDQVLQFEISSVMARMEKITIPLRVFQTHCNYVFGSQACGVDTSVAPYRIPTTAIIATLKYVDIPLSVYTTAGSPADASAFWASGSVLMQNGNIALQGRPIQRVEVLSDRLRFWVRYAFPDIAEPGDGVVITRGCEKDKTACQIRQGNVLNYGGFEEQPPEIFTPDLKWNMPGIS